MLNLVDCKHSPYNALAKTECANKADNRRLTVYIIYCNDDLLFRNIKLPYWKLNFFNTNFTKTTKEFTAKGTPKSYNNIYKNSTL
jgi:hypothetical protein